MDIPHPERRQEPMPWFKIWAKDTIHGTTFQELGAGPRAVWFSLLCFACNSREPGTIGVGSPITMGYTASQLSAMMYLDVGEVENAIKRLIEVNKITVTKDGIIVITNWKVYQAPQDNAHRVAKYRERKEQRNTSRYNPRYKSRYQKHVPEVTEVTEVKSNTNTLPNSEPQMPKLGDVRFDTFWKNYPRKIGKGHAEKAWKKIGPDEILFKKILDKIDKAKHSEQWNKQNGEFIPYPATWLNRKGWEDEEVPSKDDWTYG